MICMIIADEREIVNGFLDRINNGMPVVSLKIKLWLMTNDVDGIKECIVINTQKNEKKYCFLEQKSYNEFMKYKN